ncbi:MAG: hypothetical protein ACK4NY_19805 [Spirosomataceae bacterium]
MKKISFVNVSNNNESLEIFQLNYQKKSGTVLPLNYLQQSYSMLFVKGEKVLGGYVLNGNAPYRYLSFFNEEQKELLLNTHMLREEELLEITCNWIAPRLSFNEWIYYYGFMFIHTLWVAIKLNKRKIIGGSVVPRLQLMQRQILTKLIYCSFISQAQSIVSEPKGILMIYYNSVSGFFAQMIGSFIRRIFMPQSNRKKVKWVSVGRRR